MALKMFCDPNLSPKWVSRPQDFYKQPKYTIFITFFATNVCYSPNYAAFNQIVIVLCLF